MTPIAYAYVWAYIWTTAADTSNNGREDLLDALYSAIDCVSATFDEVPSEARGLRCTMILVANQQPKAQRRMRAWSQSKCCSVPFLTSGTKVMLFSLRYRIVGM